MGATIPSCGVDKVTNFKIFGKNLTTQETSDLTVLVEEALGHEAQIEILDLIGSADPTCDDEIIFALMSPPVCGDPDLEKNLASAQNGGRRVICIWPKDQATVDLPLATKKYAYSVISWDANKLSTVIADDDIMCFESSVGEPLAKVEVERNMCVDEPGKPK